MRVEVLGSRGLKNQNSGESNGKDHGNLHRNWVLEGLTGTIARLGFLV